MFRQTQPTLADLENSLAFAGGRATNTGNNLEIALINQGRGDHGVREFLEATGSAPGNANFPYNLGVTLTQRGDSAQGRRHLETSVRLDPSFAPTREAVALFTRKS